MKALIKILTEDSYEKMSISGFTKYEEEDDFPLLNTHCMYPLSVLQVILIRT